MSKEVTREDMEACLTFWVSRCKGRASSHKLLCGSICTKDAIKQCKRTEKAIRALIEHGPEVSRGFVEKWVNKICISTHYDDEHLNNAIAMLTEAGVEVEK